MHQFFQIKHLLFSLLIVLSGCSTGNNGISILYLFDTSGSYHKYALPASVNLAKKIFKNISSEFANQDLNVDMSFSISEVDVLNKLYFPKIRETDLSFQIDSLQILMDNIEKVLSKSIDYYDAGLPDVLLRYYIYKLTNVYNGKESYFMEGSATWGSSFRERSSLQWSPFGNKYSADHGIDELKEDLISRCKGKILELRYGGSIGKVVEKLDHETVKIKLKNLDY